MSTQTAENKKKYGVQVASNYVTLVPISAETGQNTETNDTAWQSHKTEFFS